MSDFNVQVGSILAGDFRIDRALSAGGMGAVYVAEQISTGKHRALKVMLPALVADPALRKRFEQEARIGSLIESEHVVEVVAAGIDQGTGLPWLAMELLQGEDLDKVVTTRGALPLGDVLTVFEQLCHAVGAAHRVGVVHRDLKPENIFLAQARRAGASFMVKVLDFGIAKIVAEASTKQTAAMGSPIWMAPEQADQSPITPGTDVWALGLITYFLITGRPYWRCATDESPTIPQILKEVLFEPLVPASLRATERGDTLPPGFDAWFSQCVVRDPAQRFPDATQAGAALRAAIGSSVSANGPPSAFAATGTAPALSGFTTGAVGGATGSGPIAHAPSGPVGGPSGTGVSGSYTIPRQPTDPAITPPPPKVPGAVIAAIVVAAVALCSAVGGGFWYMRRAQPPAAAGTTAAAAESGPDMPTVLEAKRLSDDGKYDAAHQKLASVPAGSPARQSAEFKDVEFKWASETLLLADRAPDAPAKRTLLESVAQCTTVDDALRANARDRLAAVEAADGGVARANVSRTTLHQFKQPTSSPAATAAAVVVPAATPETPPAQQPAAPTRSLNELAASQVPADLWTARRILEPKVVGGSATVEEVHLLIKICATQKDKPCQSMAKKALKR